MNRPENSFSLAKSVSERQDWEGRCKTILQRTWPLAPVAACMPRMTERHCLSFGVKCEEREEVSRPLWASTQLPSENKVCVSFCMFFSKPKEDPAVLSADFFFLVPWKMILECFTALLFFQAEGVGVLLDWANVSCNNIDSDDGKWRYSL